MLKKKRSTNNGGKKTSKIWSAGLETREKREITSKGMKKEGRPVKGNTKGGREKGKRKRRKSLSAREAKFIKKK